MVADILPAAPFPPPPPRPSKFNFFRTWSYCISNSNRIRKCSNMVVKIFARRTPSTDPMGQKVKIHFFSELVHVAYKIKGNHECGNNVANILPAPPTPWGWGQQFKSLLFQNMVMLLIKSKGITKCSNMVEIVQVSFFFIELFSEN